jgi:hypothetical protein
MDHDWLGEVFFCHAVAQLKLLGEVEVQLYGSALVRTADEVAEVEVNLRAIECAIAFLD